VKSLEQPAFRALMQFYKIPRALLAPNEELRSLLERETGKPTSLMPRGVDTDLFTPSRRRHPNWMVNIGYVGRLSAEKNVRLLRSLEDALDAEGLDVRFTIVGDGSERGWLTKHMQRAEFTGVLHGGELATAYAQMDILAFPSEADTAGNCILEAMASGIPVVAMDRGAPRSLLDHDRTGLMASDRQGFIDAVRSLVKSRVKRDSLGAAARAHAIALSSWDRNFYDICRVYGLAIGTPQAFLACHRKSA
jgi:glycosyltransferase involved in cell wall biosynthesis